MYKQYFHDMQFTALPLFALVLFIGVFALVIARTWGARKKTDYQDLAALPLLQDDQPSRKEVIS
jgi:cytochrome c oxidase cbb3-type subunit 4